MQLQKKSFIGYVMNIFLVGEELFENIEKKGLSKYLITNHDRIVSSLFFDKYEERKDTITKFMQSRFMKNNYKELSDFVSVYYNNTRR